LRARKTVIGVLASHDDNFTNQDLSQLLEWLYTNERDKLRQFHFLFTGGTFGRVVLGEPNSNYQMANEKARSFIEKHSTRLPGFARGGVTILTNFVVQRQCSIVWAFLSPNSSHWLNPENLALMRICDTLKVRRFFNSHSVKAWFRYEVVKHYRLNSQNIPLKLLFGTRHCSLASPPLLATSAVGGQHWKLPDPNFNTISGFRIEKECLGGNPFKNLTIALIAHNRLKEKIVDFVVEYEYELSRFKRILATQSTGQAVQQAARSLAGKICLCRSGPLGGDVEIATEILYGHCDVVIFFVDPQTPHPHIEDVRTLFTACMRKGGVLIFTNEEHARDWMNTVVRSHS